MSTREQCMAALDRANEIRTANAATVKKIRVLRAAEGRNRVAEILSEPDEYQLVIPLERLLLSIYGVGEQKVRMLLRATGLGGRRRVGELTERQRTWVATILRTQGPLSPWNTSDSKASEVAA